MKYKVVVISIGVILLVGCSGGDSNELPTTVDPNTPGQPTAVTAWTLVGTVQLPSTETAANIKIATSLDVLDNSGNNIVSDVVKLEPSGNPPMANFTLNIDVTAQQVNTQTIMDLFVFNDANDNGINDRGEAFRGLSPLDVTSGVWGNGVSYNNLAYFQYRLKGSTNTPVSGWYYPMCSDVDGKCLTLISTDNDLLTGAVLRYDQSNSRPLQP